MVGLFWSDPEPLGEGDRLNSIDVVEGVDVFINGDSLFNELLK
jgi:hypothetical protein